MNLFGEFWKNSWYGHWKDFSEIINKYILDKKRVEEFKLFW